MPSLLHSQMDTWSIQKAAWCTHTSGPRTVWPYFKVSPCVAFCCNYFASVGGRNRLKYSPNKMIILNYLKKKVVIRIEFSTKVKVVKLKWDTIVVGLDSMIKAFTCTHISSMSLKPALCFETSWVSSLLRSSWRPALTKEPWIFSLWDDSWGYELIVWSFLIEFAICHFVKQD